MVAKQEKSQVTLFFILGIIIVIMVVTLIFINKSSVKNTLRQEIISAKEIVFDVQPVKNFVQECLYVVSKDGLNKSFGRLLIKEQLETFVKNNIDNCLDFSVFEKQGLDISRKEVIIAVSVNENDVVFRMDYPIIVSNPIKDEKTEIKNFLVRHKIHLEEI